MMRLIPAVVMVFASVLLLGACSKSSEPVVTRDSVGPISVKTPFDVAAIAKLLPGYKVDATVSSALEPGAHIIRVTDGDRTLFELYPSGDGAHVESVLILSDTVRDDTGIHIGSYFRDIFTATKPSGCMAGAMEKRGRIYCPQPGSNRIIYELQGIPPAPDGQVPPPEVLPDWHVTAILWDGDDSSQ